MPLDSGARREFDIFLNRLRASRPARSRDCRDLYAAADDITSGASEQEECGFD